jgi:hypothetical protein
MNPTPNMQPAQNPFDPSRKDYGNISSLMRQGISPDYINSQFALGKKGAARGSFVDNNDIGRFTQGWTAAGNKLGNPYSTMSNIPTLENLSGASFQFNKDQYMPEINSRAAGIYDPQRAQLESLRSLQNSQAEQSKVRTQKDFQSRMQQEVEAINRRGAFFSGGAINQEQGSLADQSRALSDLEMQRAAADAGMLAQIGGLSAQQAEYVRDQLNNEQTGAYGQWSDQYDRMFGLYNANQGQSNLDRDFGYRAGRDAIGDTQWNRTFDYNKKNDSRNRSTQIDQFNRGFDLDWYNSTKKKTSGGGDERSS